MASVLDIAGAPVSDYALGQNIGNAQRTILETGGQVTTVQPMLWQTGVEAIDRSHDVVWPAPDIDYYVVSGASVGGGGALPKVGDSFITAPHVLPAYVPEYIRRDIDAQYWRHEPQTSPIETPVGISIIHNNLVFGHWLLEMFPKLLMLKEMLPRLRTAPILLPSTAPPYVRATIASVLKDWPVLIYDRFTQHVEVGQLIMPSMLHSGYQFHPRLNDLVEQHVAWARRSISARWRRSTISAPRKLFVNRRDVISSFRSLENHEALEAVAVEKGFTVVSPEKLSWRRQVELFSHADTIVGEFGSGMHNTLFSPAGARVVCLNWIVDVQSRIANFRGQSVGYLLPPDGEPRLFARDGAFINYEIDPNALRQTLISLDA